MTNESGRSMVEMLGVLAIIGVLSIGGIAGYTLAMNRYRANEALNLASQVAIIAMSKNGGRGDDATLADLSGYSLPTGVTGVSSTAAGVATITLENDAKDSIGNIIDQLAGGRSTSSCKTADCKIDMSKNIS